MGEGTWRWLLQPDCFLRRTHLFCWLDGLGTEYRYRIKGVKKRHESGDIVLFNLREPGIIIPRIKMTDQNGAQNILQDTELLNKAYGKSIIAYPAEWADSFGSNFYEEHHPPELINLAKNADTDVRHEGIPFEREGEEQYEITTDDQLHEQINTLIGSMKQEANSNDEWPELCTSRHHANHPWS